MGIGIPYGASSCIIWYWGLLAWFWVCIYRSMTIYKIFYILGNAQYQIPNICSWKFCKSHETYSVQTLISIENCIVTIWWLLYIVNLFEDVIHDKQAIGLEIYLTNSCRIIRIEKKAKYQIIEIEWNVHPCQMFLIWKCSSNFLNILYIWNRCALT